MFWRIRKHVKDLGQDMIDNYQDWISTEYTFNNTRTNINIWTGSRGDSCFIDFYPKKGVFNFREKIYLNKCISQSISIRAIHGDKKKQGEYWVLSEEKKVIG